MTVAPKRRWFQFSLMTMLVVMTLVSVPLAWLAHDHNEFRKREAVIAMIERIGGKVTYDTSQPFRESWLRPLVRSKMYREVVGVNLLGCKVTDTEMAYFETLTKLQWLDLDHTEVSDAGLAHLARLQELDRLMLRHTKITDDGLIHLAGLRKVRSLWLGYCQITDDGLRHLTWQTHLQTLDLEHIQVTDAGLVHLVQLSGLKQLHLAGNKVTKQGIRELESALPNAQINR
jgi:hypothetical protein